MATALLPTFIHGNIPARQAARSSVLDAWAGRDGSDRNAVRLPSRANACPAPGQDQGGFVASNLNDLLSNLNDRVRDELDHKPDVVDKAHDLDVSALPIEARRWHRLTEGVAVIADLKSSTQLGVGKHAASTASIYEAATGNVVRILGDFGSDFIAIQGDGA